MSESSGEFLLPLHMVGVEDSSLTQSKLIALAVGYWLWAVGAYAECLCGHVEENLRDENEARRETEKAGFCSFRLNRRQASDPMV